MRAALVIAAALTGCAPASCPDGGADAGSDTPALPDAPSIARRDAPLADGCMAIMAGTFSLMSGYSAFGAAATRECPAPTLLYVYDTAGNIVWQSDPDLIDCGDTPPPVPAGDYDIAVEEARDRRWVVGASLLRPEHCAGPPPLPPYCTPLRIHVEPCGARDYAWTLFCDPFEGACPTGFPWESEP